MPDRIELDELLTGVRSILDKACSDSCIEEIAECMDQPWIHAWFGDDD